MKYIIMLMIVIGLALADFATGWIKAYCKGDVRSSKMRKGGLNKLAEIVVMGVAIGSEIGFEQAWVTTTDIANWQALQER